MATYIECCDNSHSPRVKLLMITCLHSYTLEISVVTQPHCPRCTQTHRTTCNTTVSLLHHNVPVRIICAVHWNKSLVIHVENFHTQTTSTLVDNQPAKFLFHLTHLPYSFNSLTVTWGCYKSCLHWLTADFQSHRQSSLPLDYLLPVDPQQQFSLHINSFCLLNITLCIVK